jgi:tetratricopeptide (TPR) repeat protein
MAVAAVAGLALFLGACQRQSPDSLISAGDAALKAGNLGDAGNNYLEAVKVAPDNPRAHLALGNFYLAQQKPDLAQGEIMKALELDPHNATAHASLGDFYGAQAKPGLAEEQYRAAVALNSARADYRLKLGETLGRQGKTVEAEAELRTAIGLAPRNAQAPFALAQLLSSVSGREVDAQSEYARAQALDPSLKPPESPATAAAAAPAGGAVKVKTINKLFLLTSDSPVYENADTNSAVVAQVKKKKYIHAIGIAGNWLQIKMRNGTIGFIPIAAAE